MTPARPRYSRVHREASELAARAGVRSAPVDLDLVCKTVGARIVYEPFDDEVSGLLVRHGNEVIIAVASEQPLSRQRFTIGHELGHLMLHDIGELHVDKHFRVHFRSAASSTATDVLEIEANAFAAELLMPESLLREDTHRLMLDVEDDAQVAGLATRYGVSHQAMTYRLANLLSRHRMGR